MTLRRPLRIDSAQQCGPQHKLQRVGEARLPAPVIAVQQSRHRRCAAARTEADIELLRDAAEVLDAKPRDPGHTRQRMEGRAASGHRVSIRTREVRCCSSTIWLSGLRCPFPRTATGNTQVASPREAVKAAVSRLAAVGPDGPALTGPGGCADGLGRTRCPDPAEQSSTTPTATTDAADKRPPHDARRDEPRSRGNASARMGPRRRASRPLMSLAA